MPKTIATIKIIINLYVPFIGAPPKFQFFLLISIYLTEIIF